ncbi:trypsin-like serine protease [Xenorhabdus bovienii]|uniref:trypsin-like serine protease n=1 Tax=Xenorhabdus bovienii TaxID=40576 RepID=UPI001EDDB38B|nr:trypsin-like serine protease [Xenorhabdus bovienii]MCG3463048.1 trypsin-like serine protease [Xenorhabdus bovienii]
MIIIRSIFILFVLFYFDNSFSDTTLKYPPLESIAGGEKSCEDSSGDKCKHWVVSIFYRDMNNKKHQLCSGSLIAPNYVLTAAHCIKEEHMDKEYIVMSYDKKIIGTSSYEKVKEYGGYDFALLQLNEPVELKKYGRVRRFFNYDGAYEKLNNNYYASYIYGYGLLGINEKTGVQVKNDVTQRRADVKIVTPALDARGWPGLMVEANKSKDLKPGVIQGGDSGGPMIWDDTIIGVASWGFDTFERKDGNDKRDYPFFIFSDVTGKYDDNYFGKNLIFGQWFSKEMEQIWIDTPDWNAHLAKRSEYIHVEGWGRPSSKINLFYSIDEGQEHLFLCKKSVNSQGKWKCDIPRNEFITESLSEENDYKVTITAKEAEAPPQGKSWREDIVEAKIPSIAKEFGIVYPVDNTIVSTKDFTVRGYADPGSDVQLTLQSSISGRSYIQENLCKELENKSLIKTTYYGLWSCTIDFEIINKIDNPNDNIKWNYKIIANQKTKETNIYDQVNILFQPKEYIKLNVTENAEIKYKKMVDFSVNYVKEAKLFCIFSQTHLDCKNDKINKDKFYLLNVEEGRERPYKIGAMQKIEDADPLDPKLFFDGFSYFSSGYFSPEFIDKHRISNPKEIISTELKGQRLSGIGGDDSRYTLQNGDILLSSEYSINIEGENENYYSETRLDKEQNSGVIPIKYGDYKNKKKFPIWDITLPSTLKDSLYRIEVVDKYHPLGLADIKKNWQGSSPDKSYFSIKTPNVEIKNPSEGGTEIVGTPSFLSGRSNVPGDEVDIKRRRIERSSELEGNNQNLAQETVICSGAVVSDNGNWQCDRPIIFPAGTYELTAELIKEGKVVATDVTHITVEDKNDDKPEKKKFEINNPKNNSTIDPDNPITFSGTFSGPAGGGGGGGFGGFLSSLIGGIFGAVEGIASLLSGALGFFWEFTIHPGAIFGGDTYTMELQETQSGGNVGEPIRWTFTVPMRITEPKPDAQYRLDDGISIKGQGSPGQLVFVAGSEYILPPEKVTLPISSEGIICTATVDKEGKWACPDNPALTVANKGTFFLYAAQYQKTGSAQLGELGDTYERTSQVTRKYEVTKTKINIIVPNHGTKITKLPFTISGTGEKGSQVYIEGFGGADDCNTTVDTSSGQWSCGSYQPEDGKYTLSADQFIDNQLDSTAQASFEVQTKTVRPVVITQPHNDGIYRHFDSILPKGTGEPGTTVCLDKKVLSQVCKNGVTVDEKGNWEWADGLDTSVKGEQKLVATAFLDKLRQSTVKVTFEIAPDSGETTLTVETPKENEVIKMPSYTFSGTIPSNAKTVTVKAFGGHNDCNAKLNMKDYTWACGPYSSVPGDYDVVVVDDAGSQINRSFKVRYGANLQMRVLAPTEGEQITTSTYKINGKGQAGARITVSVSGKQICDVLVDENQDWNCPTIQSVPGAYRFLAQQWVDGVPSGKAITRNYEVGISDITIDSTAEPICTVTSASKIAKTPVEYTPTMESNGTIFIPITGTATKGAYVSLKAKSVNGSSWDCGPIQTSKTDGKWSCSINNAQLGTYQIEATQSLMVNDHLFENKTENKVSVDVLNITYPSNGDIVVSYHPPISLNVSGKAPPRMVVSYKIQNVDIYNGASSPTDIKQGSVIADDRGNWNSTVERNGFGKQNLTVSAPFCGQETYSESNFRYHSYLK